MDSWLFTVILLFVAAFVVPAVGALRVFLGARTTLRAREAEHARTVELQQEWDAAGEALREGRELPEWDRLVGELNLEYVAKFESEGLRPPTIGNADMMGTRTGLEVLRDVFKGNGTNLVLVVLGPVIGTVASIMALFPAWSLP